MANIHLGNSYNQSKLSLRLEFGQTSTLVLNVVDSYDMSTRQIDIIERDAPALAHKISLLKSAANDVARATPETASVAAEARRIADQADGIVTTKKWLSISLADLDKLVKSAGEVAVPVLTAATAVLDLLAAIYKVG